MKIYQKIDQLVGKTPLFEVENIENELKLYGKVLVKLEYLNPAGSVKDRVALSMIEEAEKSGKLKKGGTIIEPTSGNTGIGLASIGIPKGYRVILTMPDTMSMERRKLLSAYGAELVLTDGKKGMNGAVEKAKELQAEIEGSFIPDQFSNKANIKAHYLTTGPEIWEDTDGTVDYFVAGVGTGGTVSGTGKFLKEKNSTVKVIAVEPDTSPLLSKGVAGAHKIQGIGANFIPENFLSDVCDEIKTVSAKQAFSASRLLAKKEGLLVGISSGANLAVAIDIASKKENEGKIIVAILPDTGDRYLSTELF
ncbi:MAG: cysteine synthase A [Clostridiales bacterium]|nr:cysteine synthase A [Clostridiales bacterium]